MPVDTANHVIKSLQKNYGRNFPRDGLNKIFPEMVKEPARAIESAYDYFVLNSAFLPSPAQLLAQVQLQGKMIRTEESKRREQDWEQTKRQNRSSLDDNARTEHAKRSLEFIRWILSGRMTREQIIDTIKSLDTLYPESGWAKEGIELQRYWKTQPAIEAGNASGTNET